MMAKRWWEQDELDLEGMQTADQGAERTEERGEVEMETETKTETETQMETEMGTETETETETPRCNNYNQNIFYFYNNFVNMFSTNTMLFSHASTCLSQCYRFGCV